MTQSESETPLMPGAEGFAVDGGDVGVLVQHGFTGTPQSMRVLGEYLGQCGFSVRVPRLPGHGTSPEDMEQSGWRDWVAGAQAGLDALAGCRRRFIVGLSMGGTLALYLASRNDDVAGIVPINAAVSSDHLRALAGDDMPRFLDAIGSDIRAAGVQETAYERTPRRSIGELLQLLEATRAAVQSITCPALILSSREDHVVPPADSAYLLEHLGSSDKRLVSLENSYHVATLDNDAELIQQACATFIRERS